MSDAEARLNFCTGWEKTLGRHISRAIPHFELAASCTRYREQALMAIASNMMHGHNCDADPADRAMMTCRMLVDEYPYSFDHWLSLGDAWLDCRAEAIDQSPEPMQCFENALQRRPESVEAWYGLAMLLQHQRNFTRAVDAYLRVIDLDPNHIAARFRLWILWQDGWISAGIVPSPVSTSNAVEEFSGPNALVELKNACRSPRDSRTHAVILRGFLSELPFQELVHGLDLFQRDHFQRHDRRINFSEVADREKQILSECIEDQLVSRISPAWSNWLDFGFLPHRHDVWYFQVQQRDHTDRATPLHQDHPLCSQQSDWASFWVPFTSCGPGIEPTIRVLPAPLTEPIDWEGPHHRVNRVSQLKMKEYFDQSMVTVRAEPGDIVLFGRYVLHDTLIEQSMPKTRMSMDIHFTNGPARLPPEYIESINSIIIN